MEGCAEEAANVRRAGQAIWAESEGSAVYLCCLGGNFSNGRVVLSRNVEKKTMGNVYKPVDHSLRLSLEYSEARSLLEKKREAMARVAEIDRALRRLQGEDFDAVEAARIEIPFRRPRDRASWLKQPVSVCEPIVQLRAAEDNP